MIISYPEVAKRIPGDAELKETDWRGWVELQVVFAQEFDVSLNSRISVGRTMSRDNGWTTIEFESKGSLKASDFYKSVLKNTIYSFDFANIFVVPFERIISICSIS